MAALEMDSSFRTDLDSLIHIADITLDPQLHDVTELLFLVGRHLNRLGKDDYALRVKLRFCQLIEHILTRDCMVATGQDGLLRNSLLEWFTEWSFEAQKVRSAYTVHFRLPLQRYI